MKPRMNFYQAAPDTMKALMALEEQIQSTGLEKSLIELVKIRASQINGCAFCINMHTEDARILTSSISDFSSPVDWICSSSAISAFIVSGAAW